MESTGAKSRSSHEKMPPRPPNAAIHRVAPQRQEETMSAKKTSLGKRRSFIKAAGALTAASGLGFPFISRADDKPIRVGVPTILSGRVAQLGISSRNAIQIEIDKFNAA